MKNQVGEKFENDLSCEYIYKKGLEFYQDGKDEKALKLLENNEFSNLGETYLLIGEIYINPNSPKNKNIKKGLLNWEKAVDFGSGEAAREIGDLYFFGDEIKQNLTKAIDYWRKGYSFGDHQSALKLIDYYLDNDGDYYYDKISELVNWLINKGEFTGNVLYKMGKFYLRKSEKFHNVQKGIECYERGSEFGNFNCCMELAVIFFEGDIVDKDLDKSINFLNNFKDSGSIFKNEVDIFKQKLIELKERN